MISERSVIWHSAALSATGKPSSAGAKLTEVLPSLAQITCKVILILLYALAQKASAAATAAKIFVAAENRTT